MENLAILAFLFVIGTLAIVGAAAYFIDTIAERHDRRDGR